ncbi:MAG: ribonuclease P protein component [Desulfohalobiaceae bacterium]|nr:ribonuclease P protein component [Desulfohalobiaceae bacterium]MCF8104381.1 ribonuclease P protein component [Desulfohalobiaceae bacterium]
MQQVLTGYPYPGERRLKKRQDFLACYRNGRRYFSKNFILFVSCRGMRAHGLRVGTAVSKKIGKAVKRNRVKRILKEFFRLNQHRLDMDVDVDIVVVPKKHLLPGKLSYFQVDRELSPVVSRICNELKS